MKQAAYSLSGQAGELRGRGGYQRPRPGLAVVRGRPASQAPRATGRKALLIISTLVFIAAAAVLALLMLKRAPAALGGEENRPAQSAAAPIAAPAVSEPAAPVVREQKPAAPAVQEIRAASAAQGSEQSAPGKLYFYNPRTSYRAYVEQVAARMPVELSGSTREELATLIVTKSKATNFDPLFTASLISALSSFNPRAASEDGRIGLTQISAANAANAARIAQLDWQGADKLTDPMYNLTLGLGYLRHLTELYEGNVHTALLAYSWGQSGTAATALRGEAVPPAAQAAAEGIERQYRVWIGLEDEAAEQTASVQSGGARHPIVEILERFGVHGQAAEELKELLIRRAEEAKIDPLLLAAVAGAGSEFKPAGQAEGRVGLMQIEAARGSYISKVTGIEWKGEAALGDPAYNLRLGAAYLAFLDRVFQRKLASVLVAYHYGAREFIETMKAKKAVPDRSMIFARRVQGYFAEWSALRTKRAEAAKETRTPPPAPPAAAKQEQKAALPESKALQRTDNPAPVAAPLQESEAVVNAEPAPQVFGDDVARMSHIVCAAGIPPQECPKLAAEIILVCDRLEIDSLMVAALIKEQSNFLWFAQANNPQRIGLFQFRVDEAPKIAERSRVTWGGAAELKNPRYSLRLGVSYLRTLRTAFGGSMEKALTAFYWGPDNYVKAIRERRQVPQEVSAKVAAVTGLYKGWRSNLKLKG